MSEDRIEFAKLPPVEELPVEPRQEIIALLERLDRVTQVRDRLADEEDDIKNALERLQRNTGKTGFRYGYLCFISQSVAGRKSLDKGLLLEEGVSAVTIAKCYKTGNPSTRVTFKRLSEEK